MAFKYYCYYPNAAEPNSIVSFLDSAGTVIAALERNAISGFLQIRRGDLRDGTLIDTGSKYIFPSLVCLVEIRYKPLNSGGIFTVKVDGVTTINYSGDSTNGLESLLTIRLGKESISGNYSYFYFDDFVVDDANWIGNTKIGIIVPEATGTTNTWTASTGNAWDCVNEKPPVDTDYVSTNTTNAISTYGTTTISSINSVKCIQLQARAAYEGTPTPTKIELGIRAGADYFTTPDLSPGVSFGMLSKILSLNPADSAAFEQADIDGLELGIKAVA
jgi:hypothetical protein